MDEEEIKRKVEERRREQEERRRGAAKKPPGGNSAAPAPMEVDGTFVRGCLGANELGDGLLYAALLRDRFIYNKAAAEWFAWVGHHWERDIRNTAVSAVEVVTQRYLDEAQAMQAEITVAIQKKDDERQKQLSAIQESIYKRVKRLRSRAKRENCVEFAHTNATDALDCIGDDLDTDPWLLACSNGVINLRTGETRPGRQDDLITKASPVEYLGIDAPAPVWEKALIEIFDGDTELVDYAQRLFGYAMTGFMKENILPILWGQGRNGKTTIVETISQILGPLAGPIQSEMLLDQGRARSSAGPSPDIMSLRGMRVVFGSESDDGKRFSPSRVKWLSGSDSLVGRSPHDRYETTFKPTHTLILLTNHKPHAPATDFAFWERVHLVPFNLSFVTRPPESKNERAADLSLPEKLQAELPGILAWMVRGCIQWQAIGLAPPASVKEATEEYRRDEDLLADFLEECCHIDPAAQVGASDLYDAFKVWFEENISKKRVLPQKSFGKLLKGRFDKVKKGTFFYNGIRLLGGLNRG